MYGKSKGSVLGVVVPAVVLGGWILLTGFVLSSLAAPASLNGSIHTVLKSHGSPKVTGPMVAAVTR